MVLPEITSAFYHRGQKRKPDLPSFWNIKYAASLENKSCSPKKRRKPEYPQKLVSVVREMRKADPTYSTKKIRRILYKEDRSSTKRCNLGKTYPGK